MTNQFEKVEYLKKVISVFTIFQITTSEIVYVCYYVGTYSSIKRKNHEQTNHFAYD